MKEGLINEITRVQHACTLCALYTLRTETLPLIFLIYSVVLFSGKVASNSRTVLTRARFFLNCLGAHVLHAVVYCSGASRPLHAWMFLSASATPAVEHRVIVQTGR
ncbi:hypothetical protein HDK77DRAFT_153744 [Phyllosticta capitalensis]